MLTDELTQITEMTDAPAQSTEPAQENTTKAHKETTTQETSETELERLRRENKELSLQLLKFNPSAFIDAKSDETDKTDTEPAEQKQTTTAEQKPGAEQPPESTIVEFADEETFEQIIEDRGAFNKLLTRVVDTAVRLSVERALASVTPVIDRHTQRYIEATKIIDNFFTQNPDLKPYEEHLDILVRGIRESRPGLSPKELLEKAGESLRKAIRGAQPPKGFTPPSGTQLPSRNVKPPEGLAAEILELINKK